MIRLIHILALAVICFGASAVELKAGVAKAPITNDKPLIMVNGRVSQGASKDIYARVLVLNDGANRLVFVTYDLNCLDVATPLLRKRVKDELGIDKVNLILLATHNHSAPIQIVPDNFEYGRWLADTIFGLIQEAIENERGPVKVEYGHGPGYFIFARGNAPADYEIQVLKVSQGDKPIAVMFNHGTHPAQETVNLVGPGHPGFAMDAIEAALPRAQAMYCDASGGNQFVRQPEGYADNVRAAREKGPEALDAFLTETTKWTAQQLTDAVQKILAGDFVDVTGPLSSSYEVFSLPLAPPISREELAALIAKRKVPMDVGFVPYPDDNRSTNWIRMLQRFYDEGLEFPKTTTDMVCSDDTYLIRKDDQKFLELYDHSIDDDYPCVYEETIVAKIGPMPFVAMQGEVCAPIGARVKDAFRSQMPIFVTAYMGEHNLYIPTREIVRQDAYQAQTLRIQYASPVGWDPSVEDEMVNNVVRMVQQIVKDTEEAKRLTPERLADE